MLSDIRVRLPMRPWSLVTVDELRAECQRVLNAGLTYLLVKVPGRARGERRRILPGCFGKVIGPLRPTRGDVLCEVLCEVKAAELVRALDHAEASHFGGGGQ